ncbi:MAG: hypothetical protein LBG15_16560 [Dysgonamonadaceae bacterium]|jgi:hypothetical protein|nr:hypothetical protein [Dysgonamonadaceae bacterium]
MPLSYTTDYDTITLIDGQSWDKWLENGRFSLPVFDKESRCYHLSWRDLVLMVEGISLEKVRRKKRFENITETA